VRVLLVDDHTLFREGLKILLGSIDKFNEVLDVDCGQSALSFLDNDDDIDVILLDYELGDMSGLEVLAHIKTENPEIPVIMLSAHEDPELIQDLLRKGASGFITKTSSSDVMLSAISLVVSGGIYVPPAMLAVQLNPKTSSPTSSNVKQAITANSFLAPNMVEKGYQLTPRQTEVLKELGKGLSNKETARELNMSPSTVKVHVAAILKELEAKNRTVAVAMAKDLGIITN
jgi:DNA-binding NarL/FixJ family response regulator